MPGVTRYLFAGGKGGGEKGETRRREGYNVRTKGCERERERARIREHAHAYSIPPLMNVMLHDTRERARFLPISRRGSLGRCV